MAAGGARRGFLDEATGNVADPILQAGKDLFHEFSRRPGRQSNLFPVADLNSEGGDGAGTCLEQVPLTGPLRV